MNTEIGAFENQVGIKKEDVTQLFSVDGMYLQIGDVALVRSANVPEEGDHFILVTGHPVLKPHGLRPQTISFKSSAADVIDSFEMRNGVTLLKLNKNKCEEFYKFFNIQVNGKQICCN